MARELKAEERRVAPPYLVDGKEVDEALGRRYRFIGLDVVGTIVEVDRVADTVQFGFRELTLRTMTRALFERAVTCGFAEEV